MCPSRPAPSRSPASRAPGVSGRARCTAPEPRLGLRPLGPARACRGHLHRLLPRRRPTSTSISRTIPCSRVAGSSRGIRRRGSWHRRCGRLRRSAWPPPSGDATVAENLPGALAPNVRSRRRCRQTCHRHAPLAMIAALARRAHALSPKRLQTRWSGLPPGRARSRRRDRLTASVPCRPRCRGAGLEPDVLPRGSSGAVSAARPSVCLASPIARARRCSASTRHRLADIALAVGFSEPGHT